MRGWRRLDHRQRPVPAVWRRALSMAHWHAAYCHTDAVPLYRTTPGSTRGCARPGGQPRPWPVLLWQHAGMMRRWRGSSSRTPSSPTPATRHAEAGPQRQYAHPHPGHRFTGQREDATIGVCLQCKILRRRAGPVRAAGYDCASARQPGLLNRYSYVLNNPLRYTDPTGFFSEEEDNLNYLGVDASKVRTGDVWGRWAVCWRVGFLGRFTEAEFGDEISMFFGIESGFAANTPISGGISP